MLRSVVMRAQSTALACHDFAELLGSAPGRCVQLGAPVSSRNPHGPLHEVTTWISAASSSGTSLDDRVAAFADLLPLLVALRDVDPEVALDLVVHHEAKPLGAMLELSPHSLAHLAACGVGLVIDVYSSDGEGSS